MRASVDDWQQAREDIGARSWHKFTHDRVLEDWVSSALPAARAAVAAKENAKWLRCGGTWFAGVNVLGNDARGAVPGGLPLAGAVVDFLHNLFGVKAIAWDAAQVSVCYSGYPQPMAGEKPSAFRYRCDFDAAHVDGLLPEGPDRRRHVREHHAFVLGIPMVASGAGASPFVVWEGSHEIIRSALKSRLSHIPPVEWGEEDITAAYHAARKLAFERCRRVEVTAEPGEAYLVHRLALHGVAPWAEGAISGPDGRMIVYFRPEIGTDEDWLLAP